MVCLRWTYRRCRFWQKKIIFPDEAHFDLKGCANKQNRRIWGTENPHTYIGKQMHPKRVTVWCGFWSRGIIGPFLSPKMSKERPLQSIGIVIGPCCFVHKNWRGGHWQNLVSTWRRYMLHSRSYIRWLHTYIHNWPLQPFSQDYWPSFSHQLCCVC